MKRIILTCLCCTSLSAHAALDMSQDRPSSTDIPPSFSQLYFQADNPTRQCRSCPHKRNRWARCNAKKLKEKYNS